MVSDEACDFVQASANSGSVCCARFATARTSSGLDWRFPASVAGVGIFMALVYILLRRTANYSDRRFGFVVLLCLMFLSVLARSRQ
jgi:hypothetical protein